MFKNMNIKKVSLWLFVIMVVCFTISATIFFQGGGYEAATIKSNINDSKTLSLDGITKIQVSTVSTDINIIPVDTKEVYAHFYGNTTSNNTNKIPKLITQIENGTLIIKVQHPIVIGINFGFSNNLKLDVSIPKEYTQDLNINTTSGDTKIDTLNLNYFNYNSVSGNLKLNRLISKSSKLSTISGDFNINEINGDLSFHSVSGELSVNFPSFNNKIDVDTTSGDAKIKLPANAEFYLDFNTVSGDANCNFPLTSSGRQGRKSLKGTVGSGTNEIKVSTISGDLDIIK